MTSDHQDEAQPDIELASQDIEEGKQERARLRKMAWDMQKEEDHE